MNKDQTERTTEDMKRCVVGTKYFTPIKGLNMATMFFTDRIKASTGKLDNNIRVYEQV